MLSRVDVSFRRNILKLLLVLKGYVSPISDVDISRLAVIVLRKTNCYK
jgi:predicted transcriptional regulator